MSQFGTGLPRLIVGRQSALYRKYYALIRGQCDTGGISLKNNALVVAALSLVCAMSPASAAEYLITYTGTVASGTDGAGLFGGSGADLTGQSLVARFTLTDSTPGAIATDDGIVAETRGWAPSSPLKATLTIGGVGSYSFGDDYGTTTHVNGLGVPSYGFDQIYHYTSTDLDYLNAYVVSYVNDFVATSSNTAILYYDVQPTDTSFGTFYLFREGVGDSYGQFIVSNVTIAEAAEAVPEPATWVMMIAGFGFVGAAARRQRIRVAHA